MSEKIKMGIISDTHGLLREEVKERLKDCTYIFHAGAVDRPEILDELRAMGFLYVVRGNNDGYWAQNLRRSLNFSVGNVKFFMVHDRKDAAWELGDTQVVIFGHSHKYFCQEIDGREKPIWRRGDNGSDDCGKWFLGSRKNRASKGTAVEKKPKSSLIIVER